MRSKVIPLHSLMINGKPVQAVWQKEKGQWRELYRRQLEEYPEALDIKRRYDRAFVEAEQFYQLECVLSVWPGWGGGLKGWMGRARSPYANISPWMAAQDMAELRDATMKEF